jgi:hypothetical protein
VEALFCIEVKFAGRTTIVKKMQAEIDELSASMKSVSVGSLTVCVGSAAHALADGPCTGSACGTRAWTLW